MNNNDNNLRREFLRVMNENVKSELKALIPDNSEATQAILAEPYGMLSTETLDIIITTLTPLMLQHLKHNINKWFNDELSHPGCSWDKNFACLQKKRLFNKLSLKFR
ncbi:TPA: hypothetical protein ACHYYN_004759 [Escherichia coli]|uniref:Uncharacterized protein n=1 Tax=Escherichia coli TaxID=562 RepID=A0AAP8APS3_ECOLX|nr:hypothetical protein [Escherichia coli]EEV0483673.1 hypothetical protein [Escherichia coli O103]EHW31775.1 hypothetical protein ECDEC8E_1593 [Escherichia coli DEC8E]HAX5603222.1 hypothetical protein [Escherichia coli O157]HDQ6752715.1 hypothetical protein [Escherichia coli O76:H7]EEC9502604.1 hypothetical protein [Escherichia coli]